MEFHVVDADWSHERKRLLSVRTSVFVEEQKVPAEIEIDEYDPIASHALALDLTDSPIGTARMLPTEAREGKLIVKIGRVAVLPQWRRYRVGSALMEHLLNSAREAGVDRIVLHAQISSLPFYSHLGFQEHGPVFEEAGILHREMFLEW